MFAKMKQRVTLRFIHIAALLRKLNCCGGDACKDSKARQETTAQEAV